MKMTVFHDGQFWVGVIENQEGGSLQAMRHVFGPEPQDADILNFVNVSMLSCIRKANCAVAAKVPVRPANPKRLARLAAKEMQRIGASTFAQQAMQLELESRKLERKTQATERRQAAEDAKWAARISKAKAKRRGH